MTKLNELSPRPGSTKNRMRVGRGPVLAAGVLSAVRRDAFKAHFVVPATDGATAGSVNPQLYNLDEDPSEKFDLAAKRGDVLMELRALADEHLKTVVPVKNQIATRPQSKGSHP